MDDEQRQELDFEMGSLQRRYATLIGQTRTFPAAWTATRSRLRWQVEIEDVLEPDLDIEILREVLVVRALCGTKSQSLAVALLPVPEVFDASRPVIRVRGGLLEIRLCRRESAEAMG
jgi:hypothetical protein